MKLSVAIPTLNAEGVIGNLLSMLIQQTPKPYEIIIADSSSTDKTLDIVSSFPSVKVINIRKSDFNHGGTRDLCMRQAKGDFVIFMTQDAVPASNELLEQLIHPMIQNPEIVMTGACQQARNNASAVEALVRAFNYPQKTEIRGINDVDRLGCKAFYLSNVCAAYNRQEYFRIGGFDTDICSNEDMLFAAKAVRSGAKIAYISEAVVFHSHKLTLAEQFQRNKLQGYEIAHHEKLLGKMSIGREGIRMVKYVINGLITNGNTLLIPSFIMDCCARYFGNLVGRNLKSRPK